MILLLHNNIHAYTTALVACLGQLIQMAGGKVISVGGVTELRGRGATMRVVDNMELSNEGCGLYPTVTSGWILDCISHYRLVSKHSVTVFF